jgi:hypothetical protein
MGEPTPLPENDPAPQSQEKQLAELLKSFRNGANWFYWIAGLSVINSIFMLSGFEWVLIFGLGITSVTDALGVMIAEEIGSESGRIMVRIIMFGISAGLAGACALVGWLSNKGYGPIFIIGMICYALDSLLFLLYMGIIGFAFHVFVLFFMIKGYSALRQMHAMRTTGDLDAIMAQPEPMPTEGDAQ